MVEISDTTARTFRCTSEKYIQEVTSRMFISTQSLSLLLLECFELGPGDLDRARKAVRRGPLDNNSSGFYYTSDFKIFLK
jgi:hypothetical protein